MSNTPSWPSEYPALAGLSDIALQLLCRKAYPLCLEPGSLLFSPAQPAQDPVLLIAGSLRVQQCVASGQKMFLYRVHAGEKCALSTASLLTPVENAAEVVAETDVFVFIIPIHVLDELMFVSSGFRGLVYRAYSKHITSLFHGIKGRENVGGVTGSDTAPTVSRHFH